MTEKEFLDEMEWFCEFYEKELKQSQVKIWFEMFGKEEQKIFNEALKTHIKIDTFPTFPALGKIYELIKIVRPTKTIDVDAYKRRLLEE